jgi:hypothetical protein
VPEAEAGEKGARNVLLGFARALEEKQFGEAWALLSPAARGGSSQAQFAARWAQFSDISVAVLDGKVEGAAGSLYYTSPTTITARDASGRAVRFDSPIVLRRVNDVPGATAEQLRWHIVEVDLAWIR